MGHKASRLPVRQGHHNRAIWSPGWKEIRKISPSSALTIWEQLMNPALHFSWLSPQLWTDHPSKAGVRGPVGPAGGSGWQQAGQVHWAPAAWRCSRPRQVGGQHGRGGEEASASVMVRMTESFTEQADQVTAEVGKLLSEEKVDAILCVAGGWPRGNAKSKFLFRNCDLMWKQSMWASTISAA